MTELRVERLRAGVVEARHRVEVAVVDAGGRRVAGSDRSGAAVFFRSAAKPFQALAVIEDGAADRWSFTPAELALACASHSSELRHVALARGILDRIGCAEADLACGPHPAIPGDLTPPGTGPGADEIAAPTPIASNCSGKHAAMLALARHRGWPTTGYERPDHPVQVRCRETVAAWTGVAASEMAEGTDGCGVVTFAVPVDAMARAFARLGASTAEAARRVVAAMAGNPEMVAGKGRPCTALMRAYPGRVLCKVGAEGVYGASLLDRGLGVALKVEDGHAWAAVVALLHVLGELGLDPAPSAVLPAYAQPESRNTRGRAVGCIRAAGSLRFE